MSKTLAFFIGSFCLSNSFVCFANWNQVLKEPAPPTESRALRGYVEYQPPARWSKSDVEEEGDFYDKNQPEFFIHSLLDESFEMKPTLKYLGAGFAKDIRQLIDGEKPGGNKLRGIPESLIVNNPYWSPLITQNKKAPLVSFLPLTWSRSQNYGGKIPWTVYGGTSEKGEAFFWDSFSSIKNPQTWFCHLLSQIYSEKIKDHCDLEKEGFVILKDSSAYADAAFSKVVAKEKAENFHPTVKTQFVVTFKPIQSWSKEFKAAYVQGKLFVLPHPATLIFWGSENAEKLYKAAQIQPLSERPFYPEEAWHLPLAEELSHYGSVEKFGTFLLKTFPLSIPEQAVINEDPKVQRQGHRFSKLKKSGETHNFILDEEKEEKIFAFDLLFNSSPEYLGLYGKPSARNSQIWGTRGVQTGTWLLNGVWAAGKEIAKARESLEKLAKSEKKHYRYYVEPWKINGFDLYWMRPWVVFENAARKVEVDTDLLGTVLMKKKGSELRLSVKLSQNSWEKSLEKYAIENQKSHRSIWEVMNLRKIARFQAVLGNEVSEKLAEALVTPRDREKFDWMQWKKEAMKIAPEVATGIKKRGEPLIPVTFSETVLSKKYNYETEYWNKIVAMSEGTPKEKFSQKNNADCASTDKSHKEDRDIHCTELNGNHLDAMLRDYFIPYYKSLGIKEIFTHEFVWTGDHDYSLWEGFGKKQKNLVVVIPGKNRNEAVIMADHYDTAYMGDIYDGSGRLKNLKGHRHASKGSDDNHSASAALMEAARALVKLSEKGGLLRDVWLVHLTGEEFPSDGSGSRALAESITKNENLKVGKENPKFVGLFVLDMVSHSTDRDKLISEKRQNEQGISVFQISPGKGRASAQLAALAHQVAQTWNQNSGANEQEGWNRMLQRKAGWERIHPKEGTAINKIPRPKETLLPQFRAEVRTWWHFDSSLFNTDGQIFSDAGIPTVLFMENYDINREGYHDTKDNLSNIDLDYGAGLTRIAIESVAQAANR